MDPADVPLPSIADLTTVVAQQSQQIAQQGQQLAQLTAMLQQLLPAQQQPPPPPASASPPQPVAAATSRVRLSMPAKYDGDPKLCRGFLSQCSLHLEMSADQFPSERAKVAFVVSLLSGKALAWATPLWDRNDPATASVQSFFQEFRSVFEEPARAASAETALLNLSQGSSSVGDYAIRFRTLASELSWNNEALCATFKKGLSSAIKDVLAAREVPTNLSDLIHLATRIDLRFAERREELLQEKGSARPRRFPRLAPIFQPPPQPSSGPPAEEAMQVDRSRLTTQERNRRRDENLCLYCASTEHFLKDCPLRPPRQGNART